MKKFSILICSLSLLILGCKSESKEAAAETTADTTSVVVPAPAAVIDSAAIVAAYQASHAKVKGSNQNSYTTHGAKKAKVDSDPALRHHEAAEDTSATAAAQVDAGGYYYAPNKWAAFPGGEAALDKYLASNLQYPAAALENGIEGTVYASLYVDENGNIVDVVIESKRIGYGLENEVIRVIKSMPRWNPGEYSSKPVKTKFTLPVVFDLV